MSSFTKKAAQATRSARSEAKRIANRAKLVNHPEVRKAYDLFPMRIRRNVDVSLSSFTDTVRLQLTMRNLDSFKDKQLTNTIEQFLDWETRTQDFTYSTPNKDFVFTKRIDGLTIEAFIWAYVKEDSPLCKIVITGIKEEVVRTEIKQIVCA